MRKPGLHKLYYQATCLWLVLVLFILPSFSQTTNISGVVNTYHQVTEIVPSKSCVRVASTAGLNLNTRVLLIQMKGASINTGTSASFGDTTALNNAGNYEIGTICRINGDSVFLVHTILNSYTPVGGKVQLVQFGQYMNANVTGTVTASTWNNSTGLGGVIAIFAEGDLTLNAPISADARGFAGGAFVQSNTACNNSTSGYYYDPTTVGGIFGQRGAWKGECIADLPNAQNGGRGAPANAGGGGNNHNNSGGGGANLNAGGLGGGNWGTSSCNAAFPGLGGKPLSSWAGRKIFFGGGGGAGHNNNGGASVAAGGNGGGIIFIHAANIIGNGYKISASGGTGGPSFSDGAGGGGGAGTIIMDATYTGLLTIEANGGNGGASSDGGNLNLCFGGGGGGSGGVIYFTGTLPGINVTTSSAAGPAGVESGSHLPSCSATQRPGQPGSDGQIIPVYAYKTSTTLSTFCGTILPVHIVYFEAKSAGRKVVLRWQTPNPDLASAFVIERRNADNEWIVIKTIPASDDQQDYITEDSAPLTGYNLYRLKIIEKSNAVFYSPLRRAYIEKDQGPFTVYPNPATDNIKIEGNFSGSISIKLLDVSGKTVFVKSGMMNNSTNVSLPRLPAGMYILHINDTVRKLVIR
jgi:hypothetical protein